jgi:hypothetical protein
MPQQLGSDDQAASKERFMSNSTRPGGYDERLVVPLEASRRGAHRARVSPLVAALPLLAVIVVVAAVIGVAYTLFLGRSANDAADPLAGGSNPGPTSSAPAASAPAASASQPAASAPSTSASTAPSTGKIDRGAAFSVYNGSVPKVNGLAANGLTALSGAGFTAGTVVRAEPPVVPRRTTVYYGTEEQAATARQMVKDLGAGVTKLSPDIAKTRIVVIVANDFRP